jgi:hypothetical protein
MLFIILRKFSITWLSSVVYYLATTLLPAQEASVGDDLRVTNIQAVSDTNLEITFEETGDGFATFKVETSVDLSSSASAWTLVGETAFELVEQHKYRASVPLTPGENRFFRITGEGSGFDFDGDGLSNADEAFYGTDPLDPDSDNDGFSDAVEIAEGTDPKDGDKKPDFSQLPAVRFTLQNEVIEENNFTHSILLESDKPVFGQVHYTISILSNAATNGADNDVTLVSNTVEFAGGMTAAIQITIRDDAEIENIETLVVELANAEEGNYRSGSIDEHLLLIEDNDAFWTGQILSKGSENSFRMLIIEEGNLVTGKIVSSPDNGSGVIPEGEWNLFISKTDTTFEALSQPIPMNSTLLFDSELDRTLFIEVAPPESPDDPLSAYYFKKDRMVGTLFDQIEARDNAFSFLNQESLSPVVLIRDVPQFINLEVPVQTEP